MPFMAQSSQPIKVSVILGTRPEAIKLAPVIAALRVDPRFACNVCATAQHREMLDPILHVFGIEPETDLDLMRPGQSLGRLTACALKALDLYLETKQPDLVLVQGDTTTVLCAALSAFYRRVPLGHVEAGLRTGNLQAPWPEEMNRVVASRLATLHFAPTKSARQNLLNESIPSDQVFVTGNTVIDALSMALQRIREEAPVIPGLPPLLQPKAHQFTRDNPHHSEISRLVLITGHRRESFGSGFEAICRGIAQLALDFPDVHFVYPVHLNPSVREAVFQILRPPKSAGSPLLSTTLANVHLIEPLPYLEFVALMELAAVILTDSGGIQEEAPSLGKPVLVMRDTTERTEALASGLVKLVGTNSQRIVSETAALLKADCQTGGKEFATTGPFPNPYGDGKAAGRIVAACASYFEAPCRA
jgi:UDP-N-acetylglucosamine 2-epimerase (non-hydrolysing)